MIGINHKNVSAPITEFFTRAQDDYLRAEVSRCTTISFEHNETRPVIWCIHASKLLVTAHSASQARHAEVGDGQHCGQS